MVEIQAQGDDSNRNRAKRRDGPKHFAVLRERMEAAGKPWRYHFHFLPPEDCAAFFERVKKGKYSRWRPGLMQELTAS